MKTELRKWATLTSLIAIVSSELVAWWSPDRAASVLLATLGGVNLCLLVMRLVNKHTFKDQIADFEAELIWLSNHHKAEVSRFRDLALDEIRREIAVRTEERLDS